MLKRIVSKAAASYEARGTDRTSCGPFALVVDLGERKSPSSDPDLRESQWYVEPLSDARTMLANFFSILLSLCLL